ncbi:hypothetical protein OAN307_c07380 [Octadecabacter antarcticus 307]|uniref:Uncharacterized protein n=1 Tax=Octadecabacter antarcticus 307 TaxID=391626 RepID=M9R400_9RHOB|nr:hypothetical protein [Octadecabacter antarcticus]AGI66463.1 hypothetical protein OAN307_c07380 [Octadecabacter antarcticus 307]
MASVAEAGFAGEVVVECQEGWAVLTLDTYPDHELMAGIVGTNEQVSVPGRYRLVDDRPNESTVSISGWQTVGYKQGICHQWHSRPT